MRNDVRRIDSLINRAKLLKPEMSSLSSFQIKNLEEKLEVVFADDLKEIVGRFRFDSLVFEFYNFDDEEKDPDGVIQGTFYLREALGLPKDRVVLVQDGGSVVILKTMPTSAEPSPVDWIDILDLERYCEGIPLEFAYQIFPSFTDFFEYLVTEAEERLAAEKVWRAEQNKSSSS